jgi:hypothetical protein
MYQYVLSQKRHVRVAQLAAEYRESVVQDLYYDTNLIDAAGRLSNEGTSFELS